MTRRPPDLPPRMPPELADLDRDLRDLVIEERASFAAELRAELVQECRSMASAPGGRLVGRRFAAAAAALVVIGTLSVPPARASLVRLFKPLPLPEVQETIPPSYAPPNPAPEEPEAIRSYSKPSPPPPNVDATDLPDWPAPLPTTFPVLLDREMARRIIADEYPDSLQRAGIGGAVRVMLWVGPDGAPDYSQIGKTSGVQDLDMAALRATRTLRFLPATRFGKTVGTWVEFVIEFRPFGEDGQPDPENQALQIPLSN